jgi:serine protease AprX
VYDKRNTWNVNVINMSLGAVCPGPGSNSDGKESICQLVNLAESMGIAVVCAAGNDGPNNNGLPTPGAASRASTVAAAQTQNTVTRADDTIACFSNRGPRADHGDADPFDEQKPEVAAPGTHLATCISSCPALLGGGTIGILGAQFNSVNGAVRMSGTSMAAPHVAGLAALIMQAKPNINAASVKQLLIDSATDANGAKQAWEADSRTSARPRF